MLPDWIKCRLSYLKPRKEKAITFAESFSLHTLEYTTTLKVYYYKFSDKAIPNQFIIGLDCISEICLGEAWGISFYNFTYLTWWKRSLNDIFSFENDIIRQNLLSFSISDRRPNRIFHELWTSRLPVLILQIPDTEKVLWSSIDNSWQDVHFTDKNNAKRISCQHLFNEETTTLNFTLSLHSLQCQPSSCDLRNLHQP